MAISSGKKGEIFNEINITPLTDIFLVLLIIMMVIAPMFQSIDQDIKLPVVNSGAAVEENQITVAITQKGDFYVDSAPVKAEALEKELKVKYDELKKTQDEQMAILLEEAENPEELKEKLLKKKEFQKIVVLKADAKVKNKNIMKVMRAAKNTGYEKLTVAGEPLSKVQQAQLENQVPEVHEQD